MKRLLIALAAAVAVSAASARVTDKQSFEDANFSPSDYFDVVSSVEDEDESGAVAYNNDEPGFAAPYDFTDFGNKYLSLDTGDATLWRTNEANAAYVDMVMQFNPCAEAPAVSADTKISVYLNSTSNLVVQAGDGSGGVSNYVTSAELVPGTWARITIAAVANGFQVCRNGTALESIPVPNG